MIMKIALFGATGRVGNELVKLLLQENHEVRILVRQPNKVQIHSQKLRILSGNARNKEDVEQVISGCDVVISALNTDGDDTLSIATPLIIQTMETFKINRILTIGTAGILQSRTQPEVFRFQSDESRRRTTRAAEEHLKAYLSLQASKLTWTIICPTYLPDGKLTKNYRYCADYLPENGREVSVQDTAHFTLTQLKNNEFLHKRVGICY